MRPIDKTARIAGAIYLSLVFIGPFTLIYVPSKIMVSGDAAATADNVLAHETLFRVGNAAHLLGGILFISTGLALFRLLDRVDRNLALVMVGLVFVSVAIQFAGSVNNFVVMELLAGGESFSAFDESQLEALSMMLLELHGTGNVVNQVFWGLWLLPFGVLVLRSGFLPRFLGFWLLANGGAYVVLAFQGVLLPHYSEQAFLVALPFLFGELAMILWLLIQGAGVEPAEGPAVRE